MPAALSQSEWTPEKSHRLVNDYSHILTDEQLSSLEQRLIKFNDSTSNQIVIVITPTLGGDAAWAVATRIGQEWGVGQKEFDNGVVILIKSKTKEEPGGDVAIATGHGVEAALPDAFCKRIIDEHMVTPLGKGRYYEALTETLDIIEPVLRGEYSYSQYSKDKRDKAITGLLILVGFIGVTVLLLWLYHRKHPNDFNNNSKGDNNGGGSNGLFWGAYPWFMGGGHRGGGGGFGGFGGGGFGGFGGGSFGGGGASGKF